MPDDPEISLPPLETDLQQTPYELIRALARGGMGEVYEVEHRELRRRLVMKVLRSYLADDPEASLRLRAEGRMLTRLRHPNLVEVVDFGHCPSGRAYLITELLLGENLRMAIKERGAFPPEEAIDIALQTLAGLDMVHSARLVHRDIKPENLFYTFASPGSRRMVKLLDFGIAKIAAEDRQAFGGFMPTAEGVVVGTPVFMAPEQIISKPVDARTDLYALGCVLYRLLAGTGPFDRSNAVELMRAHMTERPASLLGRNRALPEELDRIVLRALEKKPDHRYQTAREMAIDLHALSLVMMGFRPAVPPPPPSYEPADSEVHDTVLDVRSPFHQSYGAVTPGQTGGIEAPDSDLQSTAPLLRGKR